MSGGKRGQQELLDVNDAEVQKKKREKRAADDSDPFWGKKQSNL